MLASLFSPIDSALSDFIAAYDLYTDQTSKYIDSIESGVGNTPMVVKARFNLERAFRQLDRAEIIRGLLRRMTGVGASLSITNA